MMHRHFTKILLVTVMLSCSLQIKAQSRLGIYAGGGISWYYGDMNDRVITDPELFTGHFNGGLLYRLGYRWNIVANIHMGSLEGADSLAISEYKLERDLHYRTDITEGSLLFNYYPFNSKKIRPYLIAGVGYFRFNPIADTPDGKEVELQPLGTEGQYINSNNSNYPEPYELSQISVPFGIGFEYGLSRAFTLRLEIVNHLTTTDYLDDLSGKYADSTQLASTPNGLLAIEMANNMSTGYPEKTKNRGDSNQNDLFTTVGISLLYTPVFSKSGYGAKGITGSGLKARKKKKRNCAAYD
jgi:hypothetical protein